MKKVAVSTAIALTLAVIPLPSAAWNIICGVSILSFGASTMSTKWEADSAAIKGMSEFYAAIAELQAVNVEALALKAGDPAKAAEVTKIQSALARFKASRDQLMSAQTKANQLVTAKNPLDNIGKESLGLWKQLADLNSEFIRNLEAGALPDLYRLHEAIDVTQRMNSLGMRASLMHLNQHKTLHSTGGASIKFK